MAYDKGKLIERPSNASPGAVYVWSVHEGERQRVEVRHVSRETFNNIPHAKYMEVAGFGPVPDPWKAPRRARRKARMRLRKRRGWR